MLDLLLECSIYVAVGRGKGNYYQLSGEEVVHMLQTEYLDLTACRNPIDRPIAAFE